MPNRKQYNNCVDARFEEIQKHRTKITELMGRYPVANCCLYTDIWQSPNNHVIFIDMNLSYVVEGFYGVLNGGIKSFNFINKSNYKQYLKQIHKNKQKYAAQKQQDDDSDNDDSDNEEDDDDRSSINSQNLNNFSQNNYNNSQNHNHNSSQMTNYSQNTNNSQNAYDDIPTDMEQEVELEQQDLFQQIPGDFGFTELEQSQELLDSQEIEDEDEKFVNTFDEEQLQKDHLVKLEFTDPFGNSKFILFPRKTADVVRMAIKHMLKDIGFVNNSLEYSVMFKTQVVTDGGLSCICVSFAN